MEKLARAWIKSYLGKLFDNVNDYKSNFSGSQIEIKNLKGKKKFFENLLKKIINKNYSFNLNDINIDKIQVNSNWKLIFSNEIKMEINKINISLNLILDKNNYTSSNLESWILFDEAIIKEIKKTDKNANTNILNNSLNKLVLNIKMLEIEFNFKNTCIKMIISNILINKKNENNFFIKLDKIEVLNDDYILLSLSNYIINIDKNSKNIILEIEGDNVKINIDNITKEIIHLILFINFRKFIKKDKKKLELISNFKLKYFDLIYDKIEYKMENFELIFKELNDKNFDLNLFFKNSFIWLDNEKIFEIQPLDSSNLCNINILNIYSYNKISINNLENLVNIENIKLIIYSFFEIYKLMNIFSETDFYKLLFNKDTDNSSNNQFNIKDFSFKLKYKESSSTYLKLLFENILILIKEDKSVDIEIDNVKGLDKYNTEIFDLIYLELIINIINNQLKIDIISKIINFNLNNKTIKFLKKFNQKIININEDIMEYFINKDLLKDLNYMNFINTNNFFIFSKDRNYIIVKDLENNNKMILNWKIDYLEVILNKILNIEQKKYIPFISFCFYNINIENNINNKIDFYYEIKNLSSSYSKLIISKNRLIFDNKLGCHYFNKDLTIDICSKNIKLLFEFFNKINLTEFNYINIINYTNEEILYNNEMINNLEFKINIDLLSNNFINLDKNNENIIINLNNELNKICKNITSINLKGKIYLFYDYNLVNLTEFDFKIKYKNSFKHIIGTKNKWNLEIDHLDFDKINYSRFIDILNKNKLKIYEIDLNYVDNLYINNNILNKIKLSNNIFNFKNENYNIYFLIFLYNNIKFTIIYNFSYTKFYNNYLTYNHNLFEIINEFNCIDNSKKFEIINNNIIIDNNEMYKINKISLNSINILDINSEIIIKNEIERDFNINFGNYNFIVNKKSNKIINLKIDQYNYFYVNFKSKYEIKKENTVNLNELRNNSTKIVFICDKYELILPILIIYKDNVIYFSYFFEFTENQNNLLWGFLYEESIIFKIKKNSKEIFFSGLMKNYFLDFIGFNLEEFILFFKTKAKFILRINEKYYIFQDLALDQFNIINYRNNLIHLYINIFMDDGKIKWHTSTNDEFKQYIINYHENFNYLINLNEIKFRIVLKKINIKIKDLNKFNKYMIKVKNFESIKFLNIQEITFNNIKISMNNNTILSSYPNRNFKILIEKNNYIIENLKIFKKIEISFEDLKFKYDLIYPLFLFFKDLLNIKSNVNNIDNNPNNLWFYIENLIIKEISFLTYKGSSKYSFKIPEYNNKNIKIIKYNYFKFLKEFIYRNIFSLIYNNILYNISFLYQFYNGTNYMIIKNNINDFNENLVIKNYNGFKCTNLLKGYEFINDKCFICFYFNKIYFFSIDLENIIEIENDKLILDKDLYIILKNDKKYIVYDFKGIITSFINFYNN